MGNAVRQEGRAVRSDVKRNRSALLEAAHRHFREYGVGTSLEAVAKEAGVGPGTLYRHFPSREALLAGVLQTSREELQARRAALADVNDPLEALRRWLRAVEDYSSSFYGLPEPLMAAARNTDPDNPLTIPCHDIIAFIDELLLPVQRAGTVHPWVRGIDLYHAAVSVAWIRSSDTADADALDRLRMLTEHGYRTDHMPT